MGPHEIPPPTVSTKPDPRRKGSSVGGAANFLKSMMGAGLLSLPRAFGHSGLALGAISYFIIALLCTYTLLILIQAKRKVNTISTSYSSHKSLTQDVPVRAPVVSYSELCEAAFGIFGKHFVSFSVVVLNVAFCGGFVIVIASNMNTIAPHIFRRFLLVSCLFPVLTLFSWIRWIRQLWMLSIFGALVYLIGVVGFTFINGVQEDSFIDVEFFKWSSWPLFAGTAVYSLEGVTLVLPIESSLKHKSDGYAVIYLPMMIYFAVVCSYSGFGYAVGYGSCEIVTNCMPPSITTTIIKLALSLSLTLTHPLTLFPASEILEHAMEWDVVDPATTALLLDQTEHDIGLPQSRLHTCTKVLTSNTTKQRILRTALVLITCFIGYFLPSFSLFSDLIGSCLLSLVGFVVPPLIHVKLVVLPCLRDAYTLSKKFPWIVTLALDIIITFAGLIFMMYGTENAIAAIISKDAV